MSADNELVARLQQQVGDRLQTQRTHRRQAGQPLLTAASEQQLARQMISEVLRGHAEGRLREGQSPLGDDAEDEIGEAIFARMFGAGRLQRLLDDDSIENIDINGADEVWISRAGDDYPQRGDPVAANDAELVEMIQTLASYSGLSSRPFDAANPELDLQLPDGSRLSALQAVAARPAVSIRRHRFQKVDLEDLIGLGTLTHETADFLRAIVAARFSVIIAGGTNAGKTTLLRAMAAEIPPQERIITIEKALELGLRDDRERHPNCLALESRPPNTEGAGGITMAQLVRRTLRQNPSRVIVGEVLGDEIVPMLNAMSQGNDGSLSTIHADSARETFNRISSYAQQAEGLPRQVVHEMIAGAVEFVVFVGRDIHGGTRRVRTVLEVNGYDEQIGVSASEVFTADSDGNAVRNYNVSVQCAERLRGVGWNDGGGSW
ncbi:MAG: ATPase, T2SS/T4P/T4SS family [Aeromicrobium sp.]|uniref:CpaF family protein n=1 Tax=Aeromicrobium sp. TaxID=1871063 RepID=UPI00260995AF|nr:ATPase, T2SS/T4P/T4SS family [Aeromicrobium sp.]MDF1705816.1 ATPase, T2SS/T4P/T4SS family [Aeromicrobium sp.]